MCQHICRTIVTLVLGSLGLKKDRMPWKVLLVGFPESTEYSVSVSKSCLKLKDRLGVLTSKARLKGKKSRDSFTHPQIVIDVESSVPHLESWKYSYVKGNKISLTPCLRTAFLNGYNLSLAKFFSDKLPFLTSP